MRQKHARSPKFPGTGRPHINQGAFEMGVAIGCYPAEADLHGYLSQRQLLDI
jgi:hypothetical protein